MKRRVLFSPGASFAICLVVDRRGDNESWVLPAAVTLVALASLDRGLGVLLYVAAELAAGVHLVIGKAATGVPAHVADVAGVGFDAFAGLLTCHLTSSFRDISQQP